MVCGIILLIEGGLYLLVPACLDSAGHYWIGLPPAIQSLLPQPSRSTSLLSRSPTSTHRRHYRYRQHHRHHHHLSRQHSAILCNVVIMATVEKMTANNTLWRIGSVRSTSTSTSERASTGIKTSNRTSSSTSTSRVSTSTARTLPDDHSTSTAPSSVVSPDDRRSSSDTKDRIDAAAADRFSFVEERPSQTQLRKVGESIVLAADGRPRTFQSVLHSACKGFNDQLDKGVEAGTQSRVGGRRRRRRVLVIFVRHFFCGVCHRSLIVSSKFSPPSKALEVSLLPYAVHLNNRHSLSHSPSTLAHNHSIYIPIKERDHP